ncbi:hypothetical protein BY457_1102 [Marinilabilia salmonicolor]|jgi:hypothetical protein|nr:hypothetical protein BY457_1102 [Marinilabilia salmonicolor]
MEFLWKIELIGYPIFTTLPERNSYFLYFLLIDDGGYNRKMLPLYQV